MILRSFCKGISRNFSGSANCNFDITCAGVMERIGDGGASFTVLSDNNSRTLFIAGAANMKYLPDRRVCLLILSRARVCRREY